MDSILKNRLGQGNSVFAALIDFQKAFDCTNRDYLLFKVLESGIYGNMYRAIKSLYSQNEACVKVNCQRTDWFDSRYGVRLGDTLSNLILHF